MMRWLAALVIWASAVSATAPDQSLRPVLRPGSVELAEVIAQSVRILPAASVLRPVRRPEKRAAPAEILQRQTRAGSVCERRDIRGTPIASIPGRLPGCGVQNPVRVTSVAGITLSQASTMDCPTAQALRRWVDSSAIPAFRRRGGGLSGLRVAAHYSCRTRNNRPGARISEHGKGKAIDISGFILRNGETVTVLEGWRKRGTRRALRKVHAGACGPFGTVLGPDSDRFHQNHFHFDTARYRGGPYCR